VSHFPRFSVFLPYSMSYNVLLSFFMFFSSLAIIQVYCVYFSFFMSLSVSSHIQGPTVCVSHFARFSVFLAIFQVLQCEFFFFLDGQFWHCAPPGCFFNYTACVWYLSIRQIYHTHAVNIVQVSLLHLLHMYGNIQST